MEFVAEYWACRNSASISAPPRRALRLCGEVKQRYASLPSEGIMNNLVTLVTLMILSSGAIAQDRNIGSFQFEERRSNHIAKLVIRTRAFERSKHTLTFADQQYLRRNQISLAKGVSIVTKVDGREPLGTDGTIPRVEKASMTVNFSGKKIVVPRGLYADCFNPSFQKETFVAKLNDAGDSLLVFMAGSDAAGGYQIMWILRMDDHHSSSLIIALIVTILAS